MSRLYVVEPAVTVTGAMADHRLRMQGTEVGAFVAALCSMLASRGLEKLAPLASLSHGERKWDMKWLVALAGDLERHRGSSLVIAGRRQPPAVHALAAALNAALGNIGVTVDYGAPLTPDPLSGPAPLAALAQDIAAGAVDTLVITAANPAYTAPADFKFAKLLERVPNSIYFTLYEDETAAACKVVVPAAHALETWGDVRATDGTVSIVQPLIAPLWGGIQEADLYAAFLGEGDLGANKLLRRYWQAQFTRGGRLRRPLGALAGRRHRSRHRRRGRGRRRRRRRRAGADGRAAADARPSRGWRSRSSPTRSCTTAASPTTPGCRSCRTRSPS